jgi:hypothetical protein
VSERKRGICSVCGKERALRADGLVMRHGDGSGAWPPMTCMGWGLAPKEPTPPPPTP